MPVTFDDYERQSDEVDWTITEGSNAHAILSFLLENPETGFTPSEIARATDLPNGSVGPTLQRLEDRDLVRHREPYWAIATGDRIAAYEAMLHSMAATATGETDEWSGVDPQDHEVDPDELEGWRERQRGADE